MGSVLKQLRIDMKKALFALIFPIVILASYTEFTDIDGNKVPYVNVTQRGLTVQMLTPVDLPLNDTLTIGAIGFKDTVLCLQNDSNVIVLKRISIKTDTVFVKAKRPHLKEKSSEMTWKPQNAMRTISPFLTLRQYARDIVYSIRNSTAEQVTLTIDGMPVVNPSSGIVSLNLMPVTGFESITVQQDEQISVKGNSVFSGIIDFTTKHKEGFNIGSQFSKRDRLIGVSFSDNNIKGAYECFDYDNMILPGNDELPNSYSRGYRFMAGNRQLLLILSNAKSGSPGLEGSRFDSAYYEESLTHIHFYDNVQQIRIAYHFTGNAYHYFNDEIAAAADSRQHSYNSGIQLACSMGNSDVSLSLNSDYTYGSSLSNALRNIVAAEMKTDLSENDELALSIAYPFMPGFVYRHKAVSESAYRDFGVKLSGRMPTFNELYWTGDAFAAGNDSLENEYMVALFYNDMRELKQWVFAFNAGADMFFNLISWHNIDAYYTPVNSKRVLSPYVNAALEYENSTVHVYAYACVNPAVEDHVDSYSEFVSDIYSENVSYITNYYSIMLYRPLWNSGVNASLHWGDFSIGSNISYTGLRFTNNENTKYFKPYVLINNTGISYAHKYFSAEIYIDNLLDTRYNDVRGYTNEGRTINVSIKLEDL